MNTIPCDEHQPELDSVRIALERAHAIATEDTDRKIAAEMNPIIALALEGSSKYELLLRLGGLIVHIGNRYTSIRHNGRALPVMPKAAENILQSAIDYVEKHSDDPIEATDIAASIPISYRHPARLFSHYMGASLHNYLMRVRVDKAIHLLMSTDLPISDIAQNTGFSCPIHFTHVFRKCTGLSPRDFRKYRSQQYFEGDYTIL